MISRPTDPSAWLFATVRTLLRRIDVLEERQLLPRQSFHFDPSAQDFYLSLPPGLHYPNLVADADFAVYLQNALKNFSDDNFLQNSKDFSDLPPHQVIAPDVMARSKILSAEIFDNDDVPSTDNFLQNTRETSSSLKFMIILSGTSTS